MITSLLSRTLLYSAIGYSVLVVACAIEIFYGSGMTHPIWDRSYDWTPVLSLIFGVAMISALMQTLVSYTKAPVKNSIKIKVSPDFGHEHPIAIRGV